MSAPPAGPVATESQPLTVALIGNPNTGKSTLFTALSGLHARIGNYPGVTVEKKTGTFRHGGRSIRLVDLPGTYSLSPRTLDEMVSVDVLLGRQADVGRPDAVVCIVDASNLERNLYLVSQVLDLGLPTVLVLNMWDVAVDRGLSIETETLEQRLGVTVVRTEAHRRLGTDAVGDAVLAAVARGPHTPPRVFPPAFYEEAAQLGAAWHDAPHRVGVTPDVREQARGPMRDDASVARDAAPQDRVSNRSTPHVTPADAERRATLDDAPHRDAGAGSHAQNGAVPAYLLERLLLDVGGYVEEQFVSRGDATLKQRLLDARERLKAAGFRVPAAEAKSRYAWVKQLLAGVATQPAERTVTLSDKIDRWLTHRFVGLGVFAALMLVVFLSIFQWAEPLMKLIETGQVWVAETAAGVLSPGPLRSLLVDGMIAGVGGVLVFLPQIVLLFFFIAVLEDCGYMARAAFLMDRLMTKIGLSGKSFVPLMSSFACAIPGVMATRVIENRRDRMVTILVAPLMSCSARLPVYVLLTSLFVPEGDVRRGLVLFGMYSLGILTAIPVAWILKKTFFKGETPPFVMELPGYKWPSPRIVASRVYDRAKAFVLRAGTLIFATSVVVWAAGYFPSDRSENHRLEAEIAEKTAALGESPTDEAKAEVDALSGRLNHLNGEAMERSLLGRIGHAIEPAVRPLGWDWKIGVGAIASFPAREVIIATLGTIYSLGSEVDESSEGLRNTMLDETWPDGRPIYSTPVAISIMVFFALCAQCAATLMIVRRETNSWRWPAFTFAYMTALAYVGALAAYQIGRLLT